MNMVNDLSRGRVVDSSRKSLQHRLVDFARLQEVSAPFLALRTDEQYLRLLFPPLESIQRRFGEKRKPRLQTVSFSTKADPPLPSPPNTPSPSKPVVRPAKGVTSWTVARDMAKIFLKADIPYALGGDLAMGVWALPRTTMDVDMNIFFTAFDDTKRMLVLLEEESPLTDEYGSRKELIKIAQYFTDTPIARFYWKNVKVELFSFQGSNFSDEAQKTTVNVEIEGLPISVLSAEALAVYKLVFGRDNDWVDIAAIIQVRGEAFGYEYTRSHYVSAYEGSPLIDTLIRFDEIWERFFPKPLK